jgi:hypothetical protein
MYQRQIVNLLGPRCSSRFAPSITSWGRNWRHLKALTSSSMYVFYSIHRVVLSVLKVQETPAQRHKGTLSSICIGQLPFPEFPARSLL